MVRPPQSRYPLPIVNMAAFPLRASPPASSKHGRIYFRQAGGGDGGVKGDARWRRPSRPKPEADDAGGGDPDAAGVAAEVARTGPRALETGRALAEPARGGRGRGGRSRVPVRGRARGPRRSRLRMGLQLLGGPRSAQLRGAGLGARTPRWPAAPTQNPAGTLPPGAGP